MNETTIVSGNYNRNLKVWNVEKGTLLRILRGHTKTVTCVIQMKWRKNETTIVSGMG
jgi:hypothetical protein